MHGLRQIELTLAWMNRQTKYPRHYVVMRDLATAGGDGGRQLGRRRGGSHQRHGRRQWTELGAAVLADAGRRHAAARLSTTESGV